MTERSYDSLSLVGYREPDYTVEPQGDGTNKRVELPGVYRVGFLVDGHFVQIDAFKAGLLSNSAAQAAKARQDDRAESQRVAQLQQEQAERERQQQEADRQAQAEREQAERDAAQLPPNV